jgi:hypothetical protein
MWAYREPVTIRTNQCVCVYQINGISTSISYCFWSTVNVLISDFCQGIAMMIHVWIASMKKLGGRVNRSTRWTLFSFTRPAVEARGWSAAALLWGDMEVHMVGAKVLRPIGAKSRQFVVDIFSCWVAAPFQGEFSSDTFETTASCPRARIWWAATPSSSVVDGVLRPTPRVFNL